MVNFNIMALFFQICFQDLSHCIQSIRGIDLSIKLQIDNRFSDHVQEIQHLLYVSTE